MLIVKKVLRYCKKHEEDANSHILHYDEYDDMYQFIEHNELKMEHSPYKYYYWDKYTNDWQLIAKPGMEV
jgi:hypothetical protein